MNLADRLQAAKQAAHAADKALKEVTEEANRAIDNGESLACSDGTVYVRRESERRSYKVTGLGGILALLRENTELDPANYLSVTAAAVKKLPEELQDGLKYTSKISFSIVEE